MMGRLSQLHRERLRERGKVEIKVTDVVDVVERAPPFISRKGSILHL
jgi:hypothetical protein